jgi:DNA-directed RNA polymerase
MVGKITRNIVKRNTMTVPYNVSKYGMSRQLWDIVDDATRENKIFWQGEKWVVVKLLTQLNYQAIFEVVKSARLAQDYFATLASTGQAMYLTPFYDYPMWNHAYKTTDTRVATPLGTLLIYNSDYDTVDINKQKAGLSPNIIHSLDAVLLYLVVEDMKNIGVIHDCFIMHPNDAEKVRTSFRQAFVKLFSSKPLEYIGHQINKDVEVPSIGTLNLDEVLQAKYIIS